MCEGPCGTFLAQMLEDGPRGTVGKVHCFCFVMPQEVREMDRRVRVDGHIAKLRLGRRKKEVAAVDGETIFLVVDRVEANRGNAVAGRFAGSEESANQSLLMLMMKGGERKGSISTTISAFSLDASARDMQFSWPRHTV